MVALTWLRGLLAHRRARLLATAAGVAVGVALLASIGAFLSSTDVADDRARRRPGPGRLAGRGAARRRRPRAVLAKVRRSPGVMRALPVGFASTTGLSATTGGSTQTHRARPGARAPGRLRAGLPGRGADRSPGAATGVLLAQQTAANLHAKPGDIVAIGRAGQRPRRCAIDGVVDLPAADSLFQQVGAPVGRPAAGAARQRRPAAAVRRSTRVDRAARRSPHPGPRARSSHRAARQPERGVHAGLRQRAQPRDALAGAGLVGDNLGTALDQAREDALYAELLFLFLGVPGAILAGARDRLDRRGRRRPPPPRRRAAAHPRRVDPPAHAASRSPRPRSPAAPGVAVGLGAALLIGAPPSAPPASARARCRHCSGAAAPRSPACAIAAGGDRPARPGATRAR